MSQGWHTLLKNFYFILFFIIILSVLFSQDWGEAKSDFSNFKLFNIEWKSSTAQNQISWINFSFIVVLICFLANAIIFMFAKAFELENLKRFAISEFFQTTASALMIVFFIAGISSAFSLIQTYFLEEGSAISCLNTQIKIWSEDSGPFKIIKCKIQEYLSSAYNLFSSVYAKNMKDEMEGSFCQGSSGFTECKIWDSQLYKSVESNHYIANRLTNLSISLVAQYFFIDYLEANLLSFFLPVGLLLRLFPPLRGIGSLFIAIVFGFYFIFPLVYLFAEPSIKIEQLPVQKPDLTNQACFVQFGPFISNSLIPSSSSASASNQQFSSDIEQFLVDITLGTFFYPFVSLIVTIIFINFLSGFLSADSGLLVHFIAKNI